MSTPLPALMPTSNRIRLGVLARQARRERTIAAKADAMFEERGIRTLLLGVGMARWTETQSDARPAAPVLLFPLALRTKGARGEDFELKVIGEPRVNRALLEKLATDFGHRISAVELDHLLLAEPSGADADAALDAGVVADLDAVRTAADPSATAPGRSIPAVLERLAKEAAGRVDGFGIDERMVIGNFAYHRMPMVQDLKVNEDQLIAHDLVAAIAGDERARAAVAARDGAVDIDPSFPDILAPPMSFSSSSSTPPRATPSTRCLPAATS